MMLLIDAMVGSGSLLRVAAGKDDSKLGEFPVMMMMMMVVVVVMLMMVAVLFTTVMQATIHFDLVVAKQLLAQNAYKDRKLGTKGSSVNDKHQLLFIRFFRDAYSLPYHP